MNKYNFKISPEQIKNKYRVGTNDDGEEIKITKSMDMILTEDNGTSSLKDLSVVIYLEQNVKDIGYYDEFDGVMTQENTITNFYLKTNLNNNPMQVEIINTSKEFITINEFSDYQVDWGDGIIENLNGSLTHTYNEQGIYTVKLIQNNPWGVIKVKKSVILPYQTPTIINMDGIITFNQNQGNWSNIPINLKYLFNLDSETDPSQTYSNNFTSTPFTIEGTTSSKLEELAQYGRNRYLIGVEVFKEGEYYGKVIDINNEFVKYEIMDVIYFDYSDGITKFIINSNGINENNVGFNYIYKNNALMGVVMSPDIQSNIFIERGKNSSLEALDRLGEVDNIGNLESYGYKFFKINKT